MQAHVKNTTSIENQSQKLHMEKLIENFKTLQCIISCSLSKNQKCFSSKILLNFLTKWDHLFVAFPLGQMEYSKGRNRYRRQFC